MRRLQTDVLVIGGGATGTGILRDLSLRGFNCILVERRDLAYGTTGRYHGLLHSGGRYVVKDPTAARECIEENRILRKIMPHCIEDTGGFFVLAFGDDPTYVPKFIQGCHSAGIPVEELTIKQMLKAEPLLDPRIERCFYVPDGSADSFLAADLNAESARENGAMLLLYHEVVSLMKDKSETAQPKKVVGVHCRDLVKDEDIFIDATLVVNASGAWTGKIAETAGIVLQMAPGKGTMVALNHRIVDTVINRCKPPSDGDILVPAHTVAVMGTTDIRVNNPDHFSIEPWEIQLMLNEGEKIIPSFKQFRVLRAWAGVRPLLKDGDANNNRDISRAFTLIDHSIRDGIDGLVTITGGKWTTYRKMSEVTVDKVCEKLGVKHECRTHLEVLPSRQDILKTTLYVGAKLEKVEKQKDYGQLTCECELVSQAECIDAIVHNHAVTIDDIRRDTRLGMGPCQAAFCGFRIAGLLHNLKQASVMETNAYLRDFLQERWKGNQPVLWGQQLRQARLNELIYINTLNIHQLPGDLADHLASKNYAEASQPSELTNYNESKQTLKPISTTFSTEADVAIVGSGLAGLTSAWRVGASGKKVHIITKGWGATYWSTGCVDIFGYEPPLFTERIEKPLSFLEKFIKTSPKHPYAVIGVDNILKAVKNFLEFCQQNQYPYQGDLQNNFILPTAIGTIRPTCLVPMTMIAGDLHTRSPMLIVGFDQYLDFYPSMVADNLISQGFLAKDISLDLPTLRKNRYVTSMVLARLFDIPSFREEVIYSLKNQSRYVERIGFPAVLGIDKSLDVTKHLEESLGVRVFEIPGLPPSIPGIRLHNLLSNTILSHHGIIDNGMQVILADVESKTVKSVWSEAASRVIGHRAKDFIVATGGILGGGIVVNHNGYAKDTVFDLPIKIPQPHSSKFQDRFLSSKGHPIFQSGLQVDNELHPVSENGDLEFENVHAAGSIIGNCDPVRELSLEGIAITTGFFVGENI